MSLILLLLAWPASAAKPIDLGAWASVTVDYTMRSTGTVACQTVYRGAGASPVVDKDRITFAGTWEIVSDSCQGNTVFAPADKVAHHTLRLQKGGKAFEEWVVHAKATDHVRFDTDFKARGQYWINELAAAPSDTGVVTWQGSEEQGMFPLVITIAHDLKITLSATAPEVGPAAPDAGPVAPEVGPVAPEAAPAPTGAPQP